MAAGRPSPHNATTWQTARDSIAAGVPWPEVSRATGIPETALRKRSSRERWHVPSTSQRKARQTARSSPKAPQSTRSDSYICDAASKGVSSGQMIPSPISGKKEGVIGGRAGDPRDEANVKTAALVLQTLGKNEEKASLMASNIATQLIEQAATSKKHKLARLEDVQDLAKALGVVRTANGSDKEEGRVTVNLFAPQGSSGPIDAASRFRRRVIDVDAEQVPQDV